MNSKTWYVYPNGDGTADVFRGDTTSAVQTVDYDGDAETAAKKAMDAEVTPELPEQSSAGNAGNSEGLSQRGGNIMREMAVMDVVIGPPPSLQ